jgi:hypothetical protein
MNVPDCMHCQRPLEEHMRLPDGNSACADGKNTFNFKLQISTEAAKFVKANLDKPSKELAQGWIEQVRAKAAVAREALQRDGAKARAKADSGQPLSLFDALESIGATVDPIWHGEWSGPILFNDPKGAQRLILVEQADHALFDVWYGKNPNFFGEELQEHGREALVRMCARPIDPKDYV